MSVISRKLAAIQKGVLLTQITGQELLIEEVDFFVFSDSEAHVPVTL